MARHQASGTGGLSSAANPSTANQALQELPPRDTTALVRTVRDRLRLAIAQREIPEGTRLNQVQVATQLGVSRMPVRTAITDLIAEGLLVPMASGGVMVRTLTEQDIRNVYEVRLALESQAVRHVAETKPKDGLARIQRVIADHRPQVRDYDATELLAADREFHTTLLDATENEYFRRSIVPVWSVVERAMFGALSIPDLVPRAWKEHEEIAKALRAGDPDRAERAMRRHLQHAAEDLARAIRGHSGEADADRA